MYEHLCYCRCISSYTFTFQLYIASLESTSSFVYMLCRYQYCTRSICRSTDSPAAKAKSKTTKVRMQITRFACCCIRYC